MNLLKKFILTISCLLISMAWAQKVDTKAKAILDAVAANYHQSTDSYFKFIYGIGQGKITQNETGYFYSLGDKYKLTLNKTTQIYDGKKVYNINEEDHEVTIAKPTGDDALFSPLSFLNLYKKGYNLQYIGKWNIHGTATDLIKMTPTTDNGIKYINLFVNTTKNQILKLEQYRTDGSVAIILVSEYIPDAKIDSDTFTFDAAKYKNYLITEL